MPHPRHRSPVLRAVVGGLALAAVMGVSRFAYTALLPSLQKALGFDDAAVGLIASSNLAGYLVGVLWARRTPPGAPAPLAARAPGSPSRSSPPGRWRP